MEKVVEGIGLQDNSGNDKKLALVCYPDPVLAKPAESIGEITTEIADLAQEMIDLMIKSAGVGLAAPQVGVSIRLFVMSVTGKHEDAQVLINPELSNFDGTSELEEGCLSVPEVRAKVRRSATCTVTATDLHGNRIVMDVMELAATIVQHETDHLDGKLFIDRLNTLSRMACRRALKQLKTDYAENHK